MSHPSDQPMTHEIGKRTYVVAEVDPLDVDGVRTVAAGTGLWLVLFLGLLPFYGRLREDGHLWWLWTCLAGFGLGLAGWDFCRRRRQHRLDGLDEWDDPDDPGESGALTDRPALPVGEARVAVPGPVRAPTAPTLDQSTGPGSATEVVKAPPATPPPHRAPNLGRPPGPNRPPRPARRPPPVPPPALVAEPVQVPQSEGTPVSVPPSEVEDATRPAQPQARQKPPFSPR